ncbi:heparinase II/III family protein [Frankia sp. ACN1ag]|uniref:heparinase II/III family protein n=1 Tax=Frankia sp. ACN1ag TaxID=102891 RepID=UPI0006DCCC55|nr:heparinase II/III family protein [Frankia sp. ACN1ag]KQC36346.1 heparinase [Frankia sp. ACN1ag]
MNPPADLGRYLRTVARLRPRQVTARARLRGQRAVLRRHPPLTAAMLRGRPSAGQWPAGFVPVDETCPPPGPTVDELALGRLTLLGHARPLGHPDPLSHTDPPDPVRDVDDDPARWDWEQAGAPLLWRYHLHYWDWAWALTPGGDRERALFARLYLGWRAAVTVGHPVAWSPYVASLRAWTLCALGPTLARDTPARDVLRADLGVHRSFLRIHLETDVGGNHLLKNHKALIALAVAADDPSGLRHWVDQLVRETRRQVLGDGGHYERSPSYHCQVLADLDDVAGLLAAGGWAVPIELLDAITRMRAWLGAVLGPDGTVPLLNDGFPVRPDLLRRLLPSVPAQPPPPGPEVNPPAGVTSPAGAHGRTGVPAATGAGGPGRAGGLLLADSGLAALTAGSWHLLADVGLPCPDDLPAHAHADTLGFLLWLDGRPLLVDVGTSTYAPGQRRDAERGSAAHNTVTVDGADSTEVWGAFRAGRRARPTLVTMRHRDEVATLTAGHDGYRHLPGRPIHWRTWRLDADGLTVSDRISGGGRHRLAVLFHFAPGVTLAAARRPGPGGPPEPAALDVTTPTGRCLLLRAGGPGRWHVRTTRRATGWERTVAAPTAEFRLDAELPVELHATLTARAPSHSSDRPPGPSRAASPLDAPRLPAAPPPLDASHPLDAPRRADADPSR